MYNEAAFVCILLFDISVKFPNELKYYYAFHEKYFRKLHWLLNKHSQHVAVYRVLENFTWFNW